MPDDRVVTGGTTRPSERSPRRQRLSYEREGADGHPDAEWLAMYAERTIDADTRERLNRHLATCDQCREVVADLVEDTHETVQPAHAVPPPPAPVRQQRWMMALGGLAVAAALLVALRFVPWTGRVASTGDRPEIDALVTAYVGQPTRMTDGRLTGGFPYAPAPPVTRGAGAADVAPDIRIAAAEIEASAAATRSPQRVWALGLAHLALGQHDEAVATLEDASRLDPANAGIWNDLAVAYLARGRITGRDDYQRALDAAERAMRDAPELVEPRFNRALALEALGSEAAAAALAAVAAAEPDADWAAEARARLAAR